MLRERAAQEVLAVPAYRELTEVQQETIVAALGALAGDESVAISTRIARA
jgi:hypothetical protein